MESGLVFLHCNHFPRCQARVDKHYDGYWSLQYMSQGGVELAYDSRRYELRGEWFWVSTPGPRICFHCAEGFSCWEHRYVAFRGPLASRWQAEGLLTQLPQAAPPGRDWATLFTQIITLAQSAGRWGHRRAVNLLEGLLLELAQQRTQDQRREAWLELVIQRLNDELSFAHDYASLAEEVQMASSTLRRRFRQATGLSLHQYTLQCRLSRARALLADSQQPIKRVAEQLGYSDVYFFSKQFKQALGLSPAAFRRSRRELQHHSNGEANAKTMLRSYLP